MFNGGKGLSASLPGLLRYNATIGGGNRRNDASLENGFGNPSSLHSFGREAKASVDKARTQVAQRIDADTTEIVFTSGATEADNYALLGVAAAFEHEKGHIITSSIEHHAVLHTAKYLEKNGWRVTYLPVSQDGVIDPADVAGAIQDDTKLISLMMVNNEVGTIQPVKEIGAIAKKHGILFHTDAVQALACCQFQLMILVWICCLFQLTRLWAKGSGALYIRKGTMIQPVFWGGPQEKRAGQERKTCRVLLAWAQQQRRQF